MSDRILSAVRIILAPTAGTAAVQSPKANNPQIAHIAYTAGEIDIKAAQQAVAEVAQS